jgi:hypothetical protein
LLTGCPVAHEHLELQGVQRFAEVIPLRLITTFQAQKFQLPGCFHALRNRLKSQAAGERNNGRHDCMAFSIFGDIAHEGLVYLSLLILNFLR